MSRYAEALVALRKESDARTVERFNGGPEVVTAQALTAVAQGIAALVALLAERLPVPEAQVSAEQRRKVEAAVRQLRDGDLCRVVFRGIADGDDQYATTEPMARVDAHALVRSIEQAEERIEVVSEADWQRRIGGGA